MLTPDRVGKSLTLFARIWLKAQDEDTIDHFVAEVTKLPQVVECYLMLGNCDALVRVVAADTNDYRLFQSEHLSRIKGGQNVKTDVPSQTVKQTYALPLCGFPACQVWLAAMRSNVACGSLAGDRDKGRDVRLTWVSRRRPEKECLTGFCQQNGQGSLRGASFQEHCNARQDR